MSVPGGDRSWLRPLLEVLFDDYTAVAAVRLLRDETAREVVTPLLRAALEERAVDTGGLDGPTGDNLLQGLLALRAKCGREEALAKVELNIAMRDRRR